MDYIGPIWIIQNVHCISRSEPLVISARPPFLCELTQSQVLGVRVWTLWGRHPPCHTIMDLIQGSPRFKLCSLSGMLCCDVMNCLSVPSL